MSECVICKKKSDLFALEQEDESGEKYEVRVCGTCWDAIAKIAQLALAQRLGEIEKRLAAVETLPASQKRGLPKRVEIREKPWPNPESVFVVTIIRPHRSRWNCEHHLGAKEANQIVDLVGRQNFTFELDGGAIVLTSGEL